MLLIYAHYESICLINWHASSLSESKSLVCVRGTASVEAEQRATDVTQCYMKRQNEGSFYNKTNHLKSILASNTQHGSINAIYGSFDARSILATMPLDKYISNIYLKISFMPPNVNIRCTRLGKRPYCPDLTSQSSTSRPCLSRSVTVSICRISQLTVILGQHLLETGCSYQLIIGSIKHFKVT